MMSGGSSGSSSASECLFSGSVPIFVKTVQGGTIGSVPGWPPVQSAGIYSPSVTPYEQARRSDTITVEVILTPTINGKRALEVKLLDSVDPFFMWHSSLGEEEFFILKRDQSLLIDFGRFPYKLIELLQACVTHGHEEHPVYAAWLNVNPGTEDGRRAADAVLTITEATTFRQICHLSLRFGAVNDATMRRHLAGMLKQYREEVDGLRSRLSGSNSGGYPYGYGTSYPQPPPPPSFPPPHSSSESYQSLQERCRQLEERCAMLETSRFPSAPPTMMPRPRPASQSAMEAQMLGLESLAKERGQEINRLNGLIQTLTEQKGQAEAKETKLREEVEGKEAALKQGKEEISKANDIIRKLQDEIKTAKARLRSAESLSRQQEKLVRDSQLTFDTIRTELSDLKATHSATLRDLESTRATTKQLETELKETQTRLEENQHVVDYLHEQLNKQRGEIGETTFSPEYWARQAAAFTTLPPGEETSY